MNILQALARKFTIRQLFGILIGILVLLLAANLIVFWSLNVSTAQLAQHQHVHELDYSLRQLSPEEFVEKYPDEHFRKLLIETEKMLTYLTEGGITEFENKEIEVDPISGAVGDQLELLLRRWEVFRPEFQKLLSNRRDNVNGTFTIPLSSDLPMVYQRMMEDAQNMTDVANYVLMEQKSRLPYAITVISVLALTVFVIMLLAFRSVVLVPLRRMSITTERLAKGTLEDQVEDHGNNEISTIGKQINKLARLLSAAMEFTEKIGEGKLDVDYGLADEENRLAQSLLNMRQQMRDAAETDRQRNWSSEGLAKFAEILRLESDNLERLTYHAITNLVKYLGAQQGSIFITIQDPEEGMVLSQYATFAYDKQKYLKKHIKPGEGIIGQVYLERARMYLLDIPDNYLEIPAGLGQMPPRCLLIVPLIYNDEIHGVVEIASLEEIPQYKVEFVEEVGESIAANIATVKNSERTQALLRKSQDITEKMQKQEEEMRSNMREMQDTYREMMGVQEETEQKEANLNALINNTEDSIVTIDRNYQVMIINDVLKRRYKGTQYEGIDVGANVLDTLGAVREEWKAYYDRALAGERLDFVIKSTVNNEDSYRRYHINPVKNQKGEIIGCSVFSRDVTDTKVAENENKKLISDLTQKNKLFEAAFFFIELNAEKVITTINDLAALELGYSKDDLIGRDINDLFISRDTLSEGISTMINGEIWKEEVSLLTKDGNRVKAKSISTAVVDSETERLVKFILVFYRQ